MFDTVEKGTTWGDVQERIQKSQNASGIRLSSKISKRLGYSPDTVVGDAEFWNFMDEVAGSYLFATAQRYRNDPENYFNLVAEARAFLDLLNEVGIEAGFGDASRSSAFPTVPAGLEARSS